MKTQPRQAPDPVLALTPHACRWPIGDPMQPGFRFCGRDRVEGESYCFMHCCTAYPAWIGNNA